MANKAGLTFVAFFAFLLVVGFASATLTIDSTPLGLTAIHGQTAIGVITISYTNSSQNLTNVVLSGTNLSFSQNNFLLNDGDEKNVTVTATIPLYTSPGPKSFTFSVNGTNSSYYNTSASGSFNVQINSTDSIFIAAPKDKTIHEGLNQTTIAVTNDGNTIQNVMLTIQDSSSFEFNVLTGSQSISPGSTKTYTIDITKVTTSTGVGSFAHEINATGTSSATGSLTIERSYCRSGETADFITILDVDDRSSGDDWEWGPLKEVKLRVEVDNTADASKRVSVEIGLYDETRGRFVDLSTEDRELEETIRIDSDRSERLDFEFTLPATLDMNNNYRLYIKAFERGSESEQCTSEIASNQYSQEITIDSDEDLIIDELEMPSIFTCGSTNTVSFKLYNLHLGDEENMRINLFSSELGLDINTPHFELDEGYDEDIHITFAIPEGIEAKNYRITLSAEYDYRVSSDSYRSSETLGVYTIRLEGDKCMPAFTPTISADLDPETETIVGKDLKIEITIANPIGAETTDYIIALEDYSSWASSVSMNETTFTLSPGESKTITATFNPTKAGGQEFLVKAIYGVAVHEQRINVSLDEKVTFLSRLSNSINIKADSTFWLTIAIFVVLILIILVLLVRFINSSNKE
jgi:uncharacterized membrane protein